MERGKWTGFQFAISRQFDKSRESGIKNRRDDRSEGEGRPAGDIFSGAIRSSGNARNLNNEKRIELLGGEQRCTGNYPPVRNPAFSYAVGARASRADASRNFNPRRVPLPLLHLRRVDKDKEPPPGFNAAVGNIAHPLIISPSREAVQGTVKN